MSTDEMIRAWKDLEYRGDGHSAEHPAGEIALDRAGGSDPVATLTVLCCTVDAVWCPPTGMIGLCPQTVGEPCPPVVEF